MANMYPKNIAEYLLEDSEKVVYYALKSQLPESFDVFYSVKWTTYEKGQRVQSEADFIVASPEYGFLCLEVKGGNGIEIDENNHWKLIDYTNGDRNLSCSPYDQAERSIIILKRCILIQIIYRTLEFMQRGLFFHFLRCLNINQ